MDPGDREALATLDPASAPPCVMQFRTPCSKDGENGEDGDCTYADTKCTAGVLCQGGTAAVSAACADRTAFDESPCACTALEELAGLSSVLQAVAP